MLFVEYGLDFWAMARGLQVNRDGDPVVQSNEQTSLRRRIYVK